MGMEVVKSHLPKSAVELHSAQTVVMKGYKRPVINIICYGFHDAMSREYEIGKGGSCQIV